MMTPNPSDIQLPLSAQVQIAAEQYFATLAGEEPSDIYELFLAQLEKPLLEVVLRHTRGNQSKTAQILGLNRGTLRTKLKQYGLMDDKKRKLLWMFRISLCILLATPPCR